LIKTTEAAQDILNKQQQVTSMKVEDIVKQLQADKIAKEKDLISSQIAETNYKISSVYPAEVLLTQAKTTTESSQQDLLDSQKLLVDEEKTTETNKRGLIDAQKAAANSESGLSTAKATTEVNNRLFIDAQKDQKVYETNSVLPMTVTKLSSEVQLNNSKIATEGSQNDLAVAQIGLYEKQTDGFDRDADQKLLKVVSDIVLSNVASNGEPIPFSYTDYIALLNTTLVRAGYTASGTSQATDIAFVSNATVSTT